QAAPQAGEEGSCGHALTCLELFLDPGGLAGQIAQVIKLGATHAAAAFHHNLADRWAVSLEHPLDALAVGDLAHRERGVEAAVGPRNNVNLGSLPRAPLPFRPP